MKAQLYQSRRWSPPDGQSGCTAVFLIEYNMPHDWLTRLKQGPVLCDGAMATLFYAKGVFINKCYDELNLIQRDLLRSIHQEYLRARAQGPDRPRPLRRRLPGFQGRLAGGGGGGGHRLFHQSRGGRPDGGAPVPGGGLGPAERGPARLPPPAARPRGHPLPVRARLQG